MLPLIDRMTIKHITNFFIGILISILLLWLTFRKAEINNIIVELRHVEYLWILASVLTLFLSHWLRVLRWRFLLAPIHFFSTANLFTSLVIGYAANTLLPAHMGEFLRAFFLGKQHNFSMSTIFGTIVTERIIDLLSLVILLMLALMIHPFPQWVIASGFLILIGSAGLFTFLFLLRKHHKTTINFLNRFLKIFPPKFVIFFLSTTDQFICGFAPLKQRSNYLIVVVLSIAIWCCYGLVYFSSLKAFGLIAQYDLPWYAALVVLVLTTVSIVIPSSPGYLGTYHYLCQLSLVMFGVSSDASTSYAIVTHAINVVPVTVAGLFLANVEGITIYRLASKNQTEKAV